VTIWSQNRPLPMLRGVIVPLVEIPPTVALIIEELVRLCPSDESICFSNRISAGADATTNKMVNKSKQVKYEENIKSFIKQLF
jgi:hypothetical protein